MIPNGSDYYFPYSKPFELLRSNLNESNEGCPCTPYDEKIGTVYKYISLARIGYLEHPYEGTMID